MKVINTWQDEEALRRYTLIAPCWIPTLTMVRGSPLGIRLQRITGQPFALSTVMKKLLKISRLAD